MTKIIPKKKKCKKAKWLSEKALQTAEKRREVKCKGKIYPTEGFHGGSDDKESAYSAGDQGSIPGLGRSPGEGKGYPL